VPVNKTFVFQNTVPAPLVGNTTVFGYGNRGSGYGAGGYGAGGGYAAGGYGAGGYGAGGFGVSNPYAGFSGQFGYGGGYGQHGILSYRDLAPKYSATAADLLHQMDRYNANLKALGELAANQLRLETEVTKILAKNQQTSQGSQYPSGPQYPAAPQYPAPQKSGVNLRIECDAQGQFHVKTCPQPGANHPAPPAVPNPAAPNVPGDPADPPMIPEDRPNVPEDPFGGLLGSGGSPVSLSSKCGNCHEGPGKSGTRFFRFDAGRPLTAEKVIAARQAIASGSMPKNGSLTDSEQSAIFAELLEKLSD